MQRQNLDKSVDKTTIVTYKILLDRVAQKVRDNDENQTEFITRALVNQLEREGDLEIREMVYREAE